MPQKNNNKKTGLQCAFVGEEQYASEIKQDVLRGDYQLIYISPESLLRVLQWRKMFRSEVYQPNLIGIIVDKAHLVDKWYYYLNVATHLSCDCFTLSL